MCAISTIFLISYFSYNCEVCDLDEVQTGLPLVCAKLCKFG